MAKYYGEIPCVKLDRVHITVSGIKCLCGAEWHCGMIDRNGKTENVIYRNIDGVTCESCKELYEGIK